MCVFASGNANAARFEFAPNAGMTEDILLTTRQSSGAMTRRKKERNESGGKM